MSDQAKVRIGGDASGATKATDSAVKGLKGVGTASEQASRQSQRASEQATQAEFKYEAEVQKAIQKLKQKETQAKATEEAMKRLGKTQASGGMPGGMVGPGPFRGPMPTVGGVTLGGVGQGLGKMGGAGGAAFGAVGSSLASAAPALAAVGVAAVGLKVGLDALRAASEAAAKQAGDQVRIEQQRNDAIEQATKQLAATVLGASAEGGGSLREAIAKGASIHGVKGLADQTGLSTGQASQVAAQMAGLDDGSKKVIAQAVADAVRLGVDPVKTAEALRGVKGGLDGMDREAALRNAGNLFDGFSGQQLKASLNSGVGRDADLENLQNIAGFSTRESRAALGTLLDPKAVGAADNVTAENADRTANPIKAALDDHAKVIKKEIEVLEAMAKAEHPLVRALNDLTASMRGGSGSYTTEASNARKRLGWFSGG